MKATLASRLATMIREILQCVVKLYLKCHNGSFCLIRLMTRKYTYNISTNLGGFDERCYWAPQILDNKFYHMLNVLNVLNFCICQIIAIIMQPTLHPAYLILGSHRYICPVPRAPQPQQP